MKNYSKQREEIIDVLKETYNHPTAEDIYVKVREKDPTVSKGTIYRNLGELAENDIINKISSVVGPDRYEYAREIHNHVICTKCGQVFNFEHNYHFNRMRKEIRDKTGVEILNKGFTFEGICKDCKNAKSK